MSNDQTNFEEWAILELMGHRRLYGKVSSQTVGGASMIRIDVPAATEGPEIKLTQLYAPAAVYCITPVSERIARAMATRMTVAPVHRWDLEALPASAADPVEDGDDEDFGEAEFG